MFCGTDVPTVHSVQPYVWEAVIGPFTPSSLDLLSVVWGMGISSPMSGKQYQVPFTPLRLDLLGVVWDRRVQPYVWEAVPGSLYALKTRLTWCFVGRACPALCLGNSTRFPLRPED